jgi:ABC-2 type transport system ATP-binding protein
MYATDSAVRVRGLRKCYGDTTAVDGIDLDIAAGEVLALLGPNGAGKTTTVEILEGYRGRDAGEVSVLGADPQRAGRAWRARVGIVLQLAADAPELTVTEMVRHYAGFYPSPRRPGEAIDLVGSRARPGRGSARCPAASCAGSTSRSASSADRSCCSSTSRPRGSTLRPGVRSGS